MITAHQTTEITGATPSTKIIIFWPEKIWLWLWNTWKAIKLKAGMICKFSFLQFDLPLFALVTTCWLCHRSVGNKPCRADPGSGVRLWPVWARVWGKMEDEEGGREDGTWRVHVGWRLQRRGQGYDVSKGQLIQLPYFIQGKFLYKTTLHVCACLCVQTGNCLIESWLSSTACAPSTLPYVWYLSTWRTAVCPNTCEPGKALCHRIPCWGCVWMSARGWITWRAQTSSTEIW